MKKFLAMILMVMFAVSISITAMSEEVEIDLTSLSLEELIELRDSAAQEICSRIGFSFEDNQIGSGYYLVGEDIKAGQYEFICTTSESRKQISTGEIEYIGQIWILSSGEEETAEELFSYANIPIGQKIMIKLEDGQMFVIGRCGGMIQEYNHSLTP